MKEYLKNCPFCGEYDLFIYQKKSDNLTWYKLHHGFKNSCGVSMASSDKEDLIKKWNERK